MNELDEYDWETDSESHPWYGTTWRELRDLGYINRLTFGPGKACVGAMYLRVVLPRNAVDAEANLQVILQQVDYYTGSKFVSLMLGMEAAKLLGYSPFDPRKDHRGCYPSLSDILPPMVDPLCCEDGFVVDSSTFPVLPWQRDDNMHAIIDIPLLLSTRYVYKDEVNLSLNLSLKAISLLGFQRARLYLGFHEACSTPVSFLPGIVDDVSKKFQTVRFGVYGGHPEVKVFLGDDDGDSIVREDGVAVLVVADGCHAEVSDVLFDGAPLRCAISAKSCDNYDVDLRDFEASGTVRCYSVSHIQAPDATHFPDFLNLTFTMPPEATAFCSVLFMRSI